MLLPLTLHIQEILITQHHKLNLFKLVIVLAPETDLKKSVKTALPCVAERSSRKPNVLPMELYTPRS